MNSVQLAGKIIKVKEFDKVIFFTLRVTDGKNKEFLDVTTFDTKFFKRYFKERMWIGVNGRLHKNAKNDYKQEIIAEKLYFIGDVPVYGTEDEANTDFAEISAEDEDNLPW